MLVYVLCKYGRITQTIKCVARKDLARSIVENDPLPPRGVQGGGDLGKSAEWSILIATLRMP